MNKWIEVMVAWFVGGFIGRLIGHTYLVGHLGWPEVSGWLSVPIGSAIAWLSIEVKVIVPAIRHAYRWEKGLEWPKAVRLWFSETSNKWRSEMEELRVDWNWHLLRLVCLGLMWSSWLLPLGSLYILTQSDIAFDPEFQKGVASTLPEFIVVALSILMCVIGSLTNSFMEHMRWDTETYDRRWQVGGYGEKGLALNEMYLLLVFNPISMILILCLIALPYFVIKGLKETIAWSWRITRKTVLMINSSQRMVAMTGAAIGLSVSQIYGLNPVICGGACVLAGMAERMVFKLGERIISGLMARQRI